MIFDPKIIIIVVLGYLLSSAYCVAQVRPENKTFRYNVLFGVARSTFNVHSISASPKYPTVEMRMGMGVLAAIRNVFEIRTGIYFGLKFKRDSYFYGPTKQFTSEPYVILSLDETASDRNHFVADIPLILQFTPRRSNLSLRTGLNARLWGSNNVRIDDLSSRREIGIISGVAHRLTTRLNIGLDLYYGLTNIHFRGIINRSPNPTRLRVTNQYAQLTIEYSINKQRNK